MTRLFRIFLAGLLVLLPIFITVVIVIWLGQFLFTYAGPNSWFGRFIVSLGFGFSPSIAVAYLLGLFIVLASILLLGSLVESGARPLLIGWVEQAMQRIPFVSRILDLAKRIVGIFSPEQSSELRNMQPVWVFFGGENGAAVFALMPTSEPVTVNGSPYVGIMVPSAPVPIGGALVYVPLDWVSPAEGGVEALMNVYISMGVVPPPDVVAAVARNEEKRGQGELHAHDKRARDTAPER